MRVNRVCGSGAQPIASAAQEVVLGHVECAVAGGMENMDQAPYLLGGGGRGYRPGDAQIDDSMRIPADARLAAKRRLEPMAKLVSFDVSAVDATMFGLEPVPAVRESLERARWRLGLSPHLQWVVVSSSAARAVAPVARRDGSANPSAPTIEGHHRCAGPTAA